MIYIRGSDEYLRNRARQIERDSDKQTKWDQENMERRLTKFNEVNNL